MFFSDSQQSQVDADRKQWITLICVHPIIKQTAAFQWTWTQLALTVWFHGAPPPPLHCLSLWSCLPRLSTSPVCLAAAPHAVLPHSSLLGRGAPVDGPQGRPVQNANQALCGTSHDFPPRHALLFCYWFHSNQTGPVTFLLSGGWSAALTAAQAIPDIRASLSHSLLPSADRLCTHLKYLIAFQSFWNRLALLPLRGSLGLICFSRTFMMFWYSCMEKCVWLFYLISPHLKKDKIAEILMT